ncbi:TonB-dependent receptor [Candidatus Neomarinimicrobiota bacterium]
MSSFLRSSSARLIVFALLSNAVSSNLNAQSAQFEGVVLASTTNQAVPFANIEIVTTDHGTFADSDGKFRLSGVSGDGRLKISSIGYADSTYLVSDILTGIVLLRPIALSLEEVLVTGIKAKVGESPIAFSTIDQADIERNYSNQDVTMVLANEPGVYAYSDAGNGVGYSYVKIRGFSQERIGFYLNGIPLNDPEAHAVYWVDHGDMLSSTSDVQVQRGVGNSLYGTSVFGGTVNLTTNYRALPPGLKIATGYGNYTGTLDLPSNKTSVAYNGSLPGSSGLSVFGRLSTLKSMGYRDGSGVEQQSFHGGVERSSAKSRTRLEVIWGHEETQFSWEGVIPFYGYDLTDKDDRRYNFYADPAMNGGFSRANKDVFTQEIIALQHSAKFGDWLAGVTVYHVGGKGYYAQYKKVHYDPAEPDYSDFMSHYNLSLDDPGYDQGLKRRKWLDNGYNGVVLSANRSFGSLDITAGGDVRDYGAEHYGEVTDLYPAGATSDNPYYSYDSQKLSFSAYLHSIYRLSNRLSIMTDLRYLGHRYRFDQATIGAFTEGHQYDLDYNFIDPHFGLIYKPNQSIMLFANLSTGHREPADYDIYDASDHAAVPAIVEGEKSGLINPEYVVDLELGGSYTSGDLRVTANLYYMDFKNELIPAYYRYTDADNVFHANAKKSVHSGLELSADYTVNSMLQTKGNVSLAANSFKDFVGDALGWAGWGGTTNYAGNILPSYPAIQAWAQIIAGNSDREIWIEGRSIGKQFIDFANTDSVAIRPYNVINLGFSWRIPAGKSHVTVKGRINNVANSLYETFGYTYYDGDLNQIAAYWPAATRNYFVELILQL